LTCISKCLLTLNIHTYLKILSVSLHLRVLSRTELQEIHNCGNLSFLENTIPILQKSKIDFLLKNLQNKRTNCHSTSC
jgi:hypothetical protein